jgi:hypothetical protein
MNKTILLAAALAAAVLGASAALAAPNQAELSWAAPTTRADGTTITGAISYNVYQGVGAGSTKTKVGTITATGTTLNTGLLSSTTYCWEVTAFEGEAGPESARSNEACKTFPASPPTTLTVTVQ